MQTSSTRYIRRRARRWGLRILGAVAGIIGLYLIFLAYPRVLFAQSYSQGTLTVYADDNSRTDLPEILHDVANRVMASNLYDSCAALNIHICSNPDTYTLLARLSMVPPQVPGFNLALVDNSFISETGVLRRQQRSGGFPPHSSINGNLAHSISHELMHDYLVERIGFFRNLKLPQWKREGLCEYGAGIGVSREDTVNTLALRIDMLKTGLLDERGYDFFKWGLQVEYLIEVQGLSIEEVIADSVTEEKVYEEMMAWRGSL